MLSGDSLTIVKQSFDNVKSPRLWHPSTPVLYSVDTKIYKGSREIDNVTTDFGFRWFEWTADRGFFLNGEHYVIKGANAHQDQAGWGDAVPDGAHRRDVAMLKEAGFNFIRGSPLSTLSGLFESMRRNGPSVLVGSSVLGYRRTEGRWFVDGKQLSYCRKGL